MSAKDAEELSVDFSDIEGPLTVPVLRDRVEEIVQENLRYREVFRNYDATGINSDVVQMPVPEDNIGTPDVVSEGAEFPRDAENYRQEVLRFQKYGFEVALTMEAVEDQQVDLVQDQVDRQARQMRELLNREAFNEAVTAIGGTTSASSGADGTMEYTDILAGRQTLMERNYDPDLLIVDTEGVHDLLDQGNFLEASDEQSMLRRSGDLGQVAGLQVMEDDSGLDLAGSAGGDSSNPGALMVDTDYFGYEGERTPITTEEYEERESQTDVYRIFTRMGWLSVQSDAGVVIEG